MRDFIEGLAIADKKKVVALLKRTGDHGLPVNEEKFKKLQGYDLWEFKSYQVRLMCFLYGDDIVILTHGFRKQRNKTPRTEIERALRIKKEYLEGRSKI